MAKLPVHQPGVYNIDVAEADGWTSVGNRADRHEALALAGRQVALTGERHRVSAPAGNVIYDSAAMSATPIDAQGPPASTGVISSSRSPASPRFTTVGELKALLVDMPDDAAVEIDKLPVGTECRGLVLRAEPAAELVKICEST
ncbi:hypothetical protein H8Z72_22565 (plasmid) [Xanthomonas citri pv. citri]|uniref:hypothetical protein n=1 Tax=Xanthomonas citri TaxID=346 RepID=UPI00193144EC|nr:hypothetical protein [Xanthomonas citri]QRD62686.1 hypothetical protein H8Z74_23620 [Xanthomonas citri pv. citri]QRD67221.1 hypothetical protein H8Z73_22600 [Xanthomonas citri pv. citri]QRD71734.1 hypothetical protein H8Z72_22565 [Xanthomonas citri pv. citri]